MSLSRYCNIRSPVFHVTCVLQNKDYTVAGLTVPVAPRDLQLQVCLQTDCQAPSVKQLVLLKRYLQDKDYTAAAQLAFELKQPGRLLAVVNKACEVGPAKAHHILTKLVSGLSEDELKLCLEYIREWNTNSRHCAVAQAMLQAMLVKHQPQVHCDL